MGNLYSSSTKNTKKIAENLAISTSKVRRENMKRKKVDRYYQAMRREAKKGYNFYGHWDWDSSGYWFDDETKNIIREVQKEVDRRNKEIEVMYDLGVYTKDRYKQEIEIHRQIQKFINARKQCWGI